MFNPYKKQNDILEEFRIKAHMRSYVKDPVEIDKQLLQDAIESLKKLPFTDSDPTSQIAKALLLDAYRMGYYTYHDLTDEGCRLVKKRRYRRQKPRHNFYLPMYQLRHNP